MRLLILIGLVLNFLSCAGSQKQSGAGAGKTSWRRVQWPKEFVDQAPSKELKLSLNQHIDYWSRQGSRQRKFAGYQYPASLSLKALRLAKGQIDRGQKPSQVFPKLFDVFVHEQQGEDFQLLLTSYYEPVIKASTVRNDKYFQPLYENPESLIAVSLRSYEKTFPGWSLWQVETPSRMRGRLNADNQVVPFYSREQIDKRGLLSGQAKVIGYVEPIDAFFLQIQGSGALEFEDGRVQTVGYANQNGHDYYAIGRALLDVIPKHKMSMGAIRDYLEGLDPKQQYEFMNLNPSYVFFRKLKGRGQTSMGTEVVDGRTLASDPKVFPRGHLSLLQFQAKGLGAISQSGTVSRFVVHQDTGGAIKGPLRADLFWGRGREAEATAGKVKNWGRVYVLIPKAAVVAD